MNTSSKNKPNFDLAMNGTTFKNIAKMLDKPLSTVYTMIKCFQMTRCVKRKPCSGLKRSFQTLQLIKVIKGRISQNPVRSMRKMANKLPVSEHSIRNVVRKDLKAKLRVRIKKHLVSPSVKQKRFER